MKTKFLGSLLGIFLISLDTLGVEPHVVERKNMALVAQGGGSFPTTVGGSFGAGARFEYVISPLISLIFPVDYRFVAMGGFSDITQFDAITAGLGSKFYFSQLFWPQNNFQGFFAELHMGLGYAVEYRGVLGGKPAAHHQAATFALSGAVGYSLSFDSGFYMGGSIAMTGRGFFRPIEQRQMILHPVPELLLQLGWAF